MPSLAQSLGGARMAVGALSWCSPTASSRLFGLDPHSRQPIVSQLFGARDFALGALTATATGATLGQILRIGVAIDTADTIASLRQMRAGALSPRAKLLVAAGAAAFATTGAIALTRER